MGVLLKIKFYNNSDQIPFRGAKTFGGSINNFEKLLKKHQGRWDYAIVYQDGAISHYYHHSTGVNSIDKETYAQQLKETRVNLYIIPTQAYKHRTGIDRGKTICGASIEDMPQYDTADTLKIQAYVNNKLVATYQNGQYL